MTARERIETANLGVDRFDDEHWDVDAPSAVTWPEVVELAQKILAADARWQKSWRSVDCDHHHAREGDKFCASCGTKLEELDSMPPPDEAALDAQRE